MFDGKTTDIWIEDLWGKILVEELTVNLSSERFGEVELWLPFGKKE